MCLPPLQPLLAAGVTSSTIQRGHCQRLSWVYPQPLSLVLHITHVDLNQQEIMGFMVSKLGISDSGATRAREFGLN